jgi:hypothetical protein
MTRTEFQTYLVNHINRAITAVAASGLLVLIACSSSGRAASEQKPATVVAQQPAQTQPAATKLEPVAAGPAKSASPVVHRAAVGTLRNDDFGLALEYPWQYGFKSGHKLRLQGEQVETGFVAPGGVNLGVIEIPAGYYENTDFERAFLSANVNRKLTSDQCSHFASGITAVSASKADASGDDVAAKGAGTSIPQSGTSAIPQSAAKQVKVADQDYLMLEQRSDNSTVRTYHTYQSGVCYEFVLGLKTNDSDSSEVASADANGESQAGSNATAKNDRTGENNVSGEKDAKPIKPVSQKQVFARLEKILATVDIAPDADQNGAAVAAAAPSTTEVPQKP